MATYDSYKKINADQLQNNLFDEGSLEAGNGHDYGVVWVYSARGMQCHSCANAGGCVCQACGRCCQWTVPSRASTATFEIWSGGGGGAGNTCCGCCTHALGGAGGNYAIRNISVTPGNTYSVCAGGAWRCSKSHTCTAGMGCKSYVTGTGLSNFCTVGGCGGIMCNGDAWGRYEFTSGCANCAVNGICGADFGITGTVGGWFGKGYHHCMHKSSWAGQAPFVGKFMANSTSDALCQCGCYVNFPSGGGLSGIVACYDSDAQICCAGGVGQGGSGMVKITFS